MVTMKSLGLDKLTDEEKIALAEELMDSVDETEEGLFITEELKADLDTRLEEDEKNPGAGISWEELKAKLQNSR